MAAMTLMIQGTTSDAGKTALVTGLCRLLSSQGYRVAPFKPQNMALNSAVTIDGGEIGRAQALQAQACAIEPHTDMNPVLLKPNSDQGCQVIVHGKAVANMNAHSYHKYKAIVKSSVLESYFRLSEQYDIILVEGAGSPAEINLRENDIANMGFAETIDCPVLLIADIERGGVFAHLVGTLQLLSKSERERVAGLVINRFRGDKELLTPGIDWLVEYCNKPVLAVLPYLHQLHLEAEDSLSGFQQQQGNSEINKLRIIIPKLPKICNTTDFDPLRLHPQVELMFIDETSSIPDADLYILPGSKNVRQDLDWLRLHGWFQALQKHCRYGGKILGICGGFQMLGNTIHDPLGIEGQAGTSDGFALLDMVTTLEQQKQLHNVSGFLTLENTPLTGYEIHAGTSTGKALQNPAIDLLQRFDGAISDDNLIMGTYIHGLFKSSATQKSLLKWAGLQRAESINYHQRCETDIDRLATAIHDNFDLGYIEKLLGIKLNTINTALIQKPEL